MRVVVLVKQVPDTWGERRMDTDSARVVRAAKESVADEITERAAEFALTLKANDKSIEVVALTLGPEPALEAVRRVLSMGADSAVHVLDGRLAGADAGLTAEAIAAAAARTGFDLIVAGNASTDGQGGVIPAMVAEHLGIPHLTALDEVELDSREVRGLRATEEADVHVSASLPAVVSVTERMPEPRLPSFKGIMTAKRKPVQVLSLEDLGVSTADRGASIVTSVAPRPSREAGIKLIDDGTAAQALADFLIANHLA